MDGLHVDEQEEQPLEIGSGDWSARASAESGEGGLETIGATHTLRHSFCSRLARNGAAAAAIQQLAGHSSYATTSRYVHLFVGAKESANKLLEPTSAVGDILETGLRRPS